MSDSVVGYFVEVASVVANSSVVMKGVVSGNVVGCVVYVEFVVED